MKHGLAILAVCSSFLGAPAQAAVVSIPSFADTFVTAGSATAGAGNPDANYGGAGAMQISGSSTTKGAMQALLKFDLLTAKNTFDGTFGVGKWAIDGITLQLGTNFGTQGIQPNNPIFNAVNTGSFKFDWLAFDSWGGEGSGNPGSPFIPSNPPTDGVTWNTIGLLLGATDENLGTFTYTPVGNTNPPNVPAANYPLGLTTGFVGDATAGNVVSLRGYAADLGVAYLFNAHSFGSNSPTLLVSAVATPEPTTAALLGLGVLALRTRRRRHALEA